MASVPDAWLVDGFDKASERFASAGSSADDAFRALFECVAWAGTINERLRERGNSSPELQGLRFVRNRVIHGHLHGPDVAATLKAVSAHLQKTNVG